MTAPPVGGHCGVYGDSSQTASTNVPVPLLSSALWNAASREFFGSERRTNTTRWTPGPAVPAIAPKQSANRDDHSQQHGLNRPRHDHQGLRMTMPWPIQAVLLRVIVTVG